MMADSARVKPAESGGKAEESSEGQQSDPVCNFFRKPSRNKNIRKRLVEEDGDEDSKADSSLFYTQKKHQKMDNKLYFSTGTSKQSILESEPKGGISSSSFPL